MRWDWGSASTKRAGDISKHMNRQEEFGKYLLIRRPIFNVGASTLTWLGGSNKKKKIKEGNISTRLDARFVTWRVRYGVVMRAR